MQIVVDNVDYVMGEEGETGYIRADLYDKLLAANKRLAQLANRYWSAGLRARNELEDAANVTLEEVIEDVGCTETLGEVEP